MARLHGPRYSGDRVVEEEQSGLTATDEAARALAESGDVAGAATLLVREYGPSVLGWLWATTPSAADADDIFGTVCERLWKALPTFDWSGSPRTWMYVVGRNLTIDRVRRATTKREVPLSVAPPVAAVVASTTTAFRKTTHKNRLQRLRDALPPDDRTLLILRLDRQLPWADIARILSEPDASAEELRKASARIRKRFARLKEGLRQAWESVTTGEDRVVPSPAPTDDDLPDR